VRAEGRAETEPRVPNDTPAARARNRRVEVQLLLPRPEG
jgi:type VI secretion system protein ImpK